MIMLVSKFISFHSDLDCLSAQLEICAQNVKMEKLCVCYNQTMRYDSVHCQCPDGPTDEAWKK